MKRFTKILLCLVLCIFSITLFACGNKKGDSFLPSKVSGEVYSNGGSVVQNGNFIFFNNGFVNEANQTQDKTNYVKGSLVAAKLKDGQPVLDENGFADISQIRYITQRLTSFEAGNIFIHGSYIYYTSPCQENLKGGQGWARERVVFYRLHLNKSGKEEKIYQTSSNYSDVSFAYYTQGDDIYLMIKDGKSLKRVSANGKSKEIAKDFENAYLSQNCNQALYITKKDDKYNLNVYNPFTDTAECNEIKVDNLKVTAAPEILFADSTVYVKATVNNNDFAEGNVLLGADLNDLQFHVLYLDQSKNYSYSFFDGNVFAINGTSIYKVINTKLATILTDSSASSITVAGFANGMLIYIDGGSIKAVFYSSNQAKTEPDRVLASDLDILTGYYDTVFNNFYFYNKVNNGYYLHFVSTTGNGEVQMLGVYEEEDKPEVEDKQ